MRRRRAAPCPRPPTACLRNAPESTLLDASASVSSEEFTAGGPELPIPPAQAVASGRYFHVPILMGTNHDEGAHFAQGLAGLTEQQYADLVTHATAPARRRCCQRYPLSSYPSQYTAAYAIGASGPTAASSPVSAGARPRTWPRSSPAATPTYFYQFDDRHAPGLNKSLPGYQWGAGHAMELAYLWPSFSNGFSLYDLLTPAQLGCPGRWCLVGRVRALHAPERAGQPAWPPLHQQAADVAPARRPEPRHLRGPYAAEHQCAFWNAG